MKKFLFTLSLVSLPLLAFLFLMPRSQAQSGVPICDIASTVVCTDPTTMEFDDPADPSDEIPPVGGGSSSTTLAASSTTIENNLRVNFQDDQGKAQNEPFVAMNPADFNHLVVGAADFFYVLGRSSCGFYRSFTGGTSWEAGNTAATGALTPPPGLAAAGNSGIAFSPEGLRVFYSCNAFNQLSGNVPADETVFVTFSRDAGVSFLDGDRRVIVQGGGNTLHDKPFIAVDQEAGSAHRGNVYVSWTQLDLVSGTVNTASIRVARSTDNGETWTVHPDPISTDTFNQGSFPFVGVDGSVYVAYGVMNPLNTKVTRIEVARSTDGGLTWSAPFLAATVTGLPKALPNTKFRVNSFPMVAVDRSSGATRGFIYIAWADRRNGNADVFLARSADNGQTFSAPLQLTSVQRDDFHPAVSVDPNGNVDVVFYERFDTTSTKFDLFHKRSGAGGMSFGGKTQVNINGGHIKGGAQFSGKNIGDYISVVSGPNNTVHPVWMDTRRFRPNSTKKQQDIFGSRVTITP